MVDGAHVRRSAEVCAVFLRRHLDADWTASAADVEMTVAEVIAHAAEACLWYAIDLSAAGDDLQAVEQRVRADGDPGDLVATLRAYADVCAAVVDAAPPSARGFHPMGRADPSGMAAMACDEMLIHTADAADGLGVEFVPPDDLAAPVVHRLFPWITELDDPWRRLRWANGRIRFGGDDRLTNWTWHCAPLADWDGTIPTRPSLNDSDS